MLTVTFTDEEAMALYNQRHYAEGKELVSAFKKLEAAIIAMEPEPNVVHELRAIEQRGAFDLSDGSQRAAFRTQVEEDLADATVAELRERVRDLMRCLGNSTAPGASRADVMRKLTYGYTIARQMGKL